MNSYNIIRMARECGLQPYYDAQSPAIERFYHAVFAAGEQAERDRTKRLVEDMQNELQTLRDRLAKQKPVLWVFKDNPGITTDREPNNSKLWEPLGNIV